MTDLGNSSFYDLLPPNLQDTHARALSYASDRQFKKLAAFIEAKTLIYASVMTLEEDVCDHLALQFNLMVYETHFPLQMKREMLSLLFLNRLKKGTAHAVKQVISSIHEGADISEWFQHNGLAHTFRVVIDESEVSIDENTYNLILENIFEYKALRSSLEHTSIKHTALGTVWASGCSNYRYADTIPVIPDLPKDNLIGNVHVGGISHQKISASSIPFDAPKRDRINAPIACGGLAHLYIRHIIALENPFEPPASTIKGTIQIKYKKKPEGDENA